MINNNSDICIANDPLVPPPPVRYEPNCLQIALIKLKEFGDWLMNCCLVQLFRTLLCGKAKPEQPSNQNERVQNLFNEQINLEDLPPPPPSSDDDEPVGPVQSSNPPPILEPHSDQEELIAAIEQEPRAPAVRQMDESKSESKEEAKDEHFRDAQISFQSLYDNALIEIKNECNPVIQGIVDKLSQLSTENLNPTSDSFLTNLGLIDCFMQICRTLPDETVQSIGVNLEPHWVGICHQWSRDQVFLFSTCYLESEAHELTQIKKDFKNNQIALQVLFFHRLIEEVKRNAIGNEECLRLCHEMSKEIQSITPSYGPIVDHYKEMHALIGDECWPHFLLTYNRLNQDVLALYKKISRELGTDILKIIVILFKDVRIEQVLEGPSGEITMILDSLYEARIRETTVQSEKAITFSLEKESCSVIFKDGAFKVDNPKAGKFSPNKVSLRPDKIVNLTTHSPGWSRVEIAIALARSLRPLHLDVVLENAMSLTMTRI